MVGKTKVKGIALLSLMIGGSLFVGYELGHNPFFPWNHNQNHIEKGTYTSLEEIYMIKKGNGTYLLITENGSIIQININGYITNNNNNNNYIIVNGSHIAPPSPLEKIINEYQVFGTNTSLVILPVKSVTPLSNQSALLIVYNPNTRENQYIIVPINESKAELTNGSAISLNYILPKLPKGENLYLLIGINNPNNITESGINYIGEIDGTPAASLSANANIAYLITNASPDQLASYLQAAMNGQAKPLMLTRYGVWKDPNGLWGWDNITKQSVIVNFPSSSDVNYAKQMVELADSMLGTNTSNPGEDGVIPMVIIKNYSVSQQQGYTAYNLSSNDYILILLLTPHQGQQLESKILNGQSLSPAVYLPLLAGITSGISKYIGNPFEGRKRLRDYDIFRDSTPLTY